MVVDAVASPLFRCTKNGEADIVLVLRLTMGPFIASGDSEGCLEAKTE